MITTFVQWKGTDLCMDFYCPACAAHSHFDGLFCYIYECPKCRALFLMPSDLPVVPVTPEQADALAVPTQCGTIHDDE